MKSEQPNDAIDVVLEARPSIKSPCLGRGCQDH